MLVEGRENRQFTQPLRGNARFNRCDKFRLQPADLCTPLPRHPFGHQVG